MAKGGHSRRALPKACRKTPHFTTVADFISTLDSEIVKLFLEVLLVCDQMNLIGKEMFAIDGVKLPSNASKEWSGAKEELANKKQKMEKVIRRLMQDRFTQRSSCH
ncbi:MAG: hypothetical protein A4E65_01683 [Syntrophorhabdus sp. PtaU1.Bin153]|nr:MAG: hypothetical protein A4E65_01683 [Syntrophorhabdus sp. PtaU1.Bin153]